jgi:ElaB/YqjD/DUF883 family membrane-anchored ribosome-binding protein
MNMSVEGTLSDNGVGRGKGTAADAAKKAEEEVLGQFKGLFDGVEDLIKRVADVESPDVQKIRAKVRMALVAAKSALKDGATQVRTQAQQVASTTDGYVRGSPWQALGLATLFGVAVGLLVSRRS